MNMPSSIWTLARHRRSLLVLGCACLFTAAPVVADEEPETLPDGVRVVALEAYPEQIDLKHSFDYRQLLVTGKLATGETVDVTRMVTVAGPASIVDISATGVVRPLADGQATIKLQFEDKTVIVPVSVDGFARRTAASFVRDVQPVLSRMGCNAGTCHGSKDGKAGFKLSLRGYDHLFDHRAFTDDVGARRINRADPARSLMLLKATGSIPHVGGQRTTVGHPYYEVVRSWIAQGSKLDLDATRVESLDIYPKNPILPRPNLKQQMVVLATYADGQVRDVTQEAFVESGDIEIVETLEGGRLRLLRRGEAPVLVRYEGAYASTILTVMGDRGGFAWNDPPAHNYVDEWVYKKLQRVKVLPSQLCTDEEFVRRVYLDLTGLPPTVDQVREFLADTRESRVKRDDLVDRLVGSPEFVEHWTNKWADLLQVNRKFLGEEGAIGLRNWIRNAVATNMPYDRFAYDILTARGSTLENPPAAYYKILRQPDMMMENTTHLFLAVRFNCNKCHDHPFERWTQDQYYDLAAYFAQIGLKRDPAFAGKNIGGTAVQGALPLVEVVFDKGNGEVKHERTGQVVAPKFPFEHSDVAPEAATRREQLAHWITSAENQYFARSYVNRLWGYLMGVGIIEPIDDIRAGNPPTNPDLLDALTKDFLDHNFDSQHILRTICKSRTYQLSIASNEWNEDDLINYSHALPRRLPAEVLYDAIHVSCGSQQKIAGVPAGFRAAELPDAGVKVPFLDDFGRPSRESSCECERSSGIVLGPIMKLVNGPTVANAIADPNNALAQLVKQQPDDDKLIREVFMRFLARPATATEIQAAKEAIAAVGADHDQLVLDLEKHQSQLPAKQAEWEKSIGPDPQWTNLELVETKSDVGATFAAQEDGSVLVSGKIGKDVYTITARTSLQGITGLRLEVLPDKSLPAGGPGRAPNGNFVLSELSVAAAPETADAEPTPIQLNNAMADFSQQGWLVPGAVDGNPATGWAVMPSFNKRHEALFAVQEPFGLEGGTTLTIRMSQQYPDGKHTLGKFRLALTNSPQPTRQNKLPAEISKILATAGEQRTEEQKKALADYFRSQDKELARLQAAVKRAAEQRNNRRLIGTQDLAWALINSPAFLFNR